MAIAGCLKPPDGWLITNLVNEKTGRLPDWTHVEGMKDPDEVRFSGDHHTLVVLYVEKGLSVNRV